MNVIQDALTIANDLSKEGNLSSVGRVIAPRARVRSISSFAGNAIYYFPVLTASSVSPDTAGMCATALERTYMVFTKAVFSMIPAMVVDNNVVNVDDYLKQFHQNIGIDSSYHSIRLNEAACKPYSTLVNSVLNETINASAVIKPLTKASKNVLVAGQPNAILPDEKTDDNGNPIPDHINRTRSYNKSDYEKQTALQPSIINVDIKFIVGDKERVIDVTVPVGVKTQLHVLDGTQLADRAVDSIVGRGTMHDLIRWSTGEMLSLKDILFGVNKIKRNVATSNTEVSEWFNVLDRRKRLSQISQPALCKQSFLPNTSIILSIDDVKAVQQQYGIDILDAKNAVKLIKNNFLLAIVVVDDAMETMHVIYDGHSKYEYYPYSTVNRENASHDREMKTLIRAIGKMS